MYSSNSLSLCLDNYWQLFEGILPGDAGRSGISGNPYESAWILKADMDTGMTILSTDCRWNDVLAVMNHYYKDGTDPKLVFYDDKKLFNTLNRYQRGIVQYHFNIYSNGYMDEDEVITARAARHAMLRYLNNRITPREWYLVNQLVNSLV